MDPDLGQELLAHLGRGEDEQLAFLLATIHGDDARITDIRPLTDSSFDLQTPWHLSLGDEALGAAIRWAHTASASLIEAHVHRDGDPAHFSGSDWLGLDAFVPHVFWRLRHRPYVALVFGQSTFDGLAWRLDANTPEPVEGWILGDGRIWLPTGISRRPKDLR